MTICPLPDYEPPSQRCQTCHCLVDGFSCANQCCGPFGCVESQERRAMETEPSTFRAKLAAVDELVNAGILGSEYCPEPLYNSWPVIDSDKLPGWLAENYQTYGEIRLY